jgi:hypothetical protein
MDHRLFQKECDRRLRELGLRADPSPEELFAALERLHGRPIIVWPADLGGGPFGAVFHTDAYTVVLYEQNTSRPHQQLIQYHEAGHALFDHAGRKLEDPAELQRLAPDLPLEVIRQFLCRDGHDDPEEREAETFATLMVERFARRPAGQADGPQQSGTDTLVARLAADLEVGPAQG